MQADSANEKSIENIFIFIIYYLIALSAIINSLAHNQQVVFIETPVFTRQVTSLLNDDDYAAFQAMLMRNPEAGDVIAGTGGLRKVRVGLPGRGKRGGARVVYYWFNERDQIGLLMMYPKNVQEDLSARQRHALRAIVENWRSHG